MKTHLGPPPKHERVMVNVLVRPEAHRLMRAIATDAGSTIGQMYERLVEKEARRRRIRLDAQEVT